MKKVLKQIGKALGYFAVYFTCMNVVDLIAGFVWGYMKGAELKAMGMSSEEAMAAFQSMEPGYKGVSMLIGAILTLLIYFIIEKIKKTSLAKETDMKMVTGKQMGLTVVGALGGMFFLNFMLSILPIPLQPSPGLRGVETALGTHSAWTLTSRGTQCTHFPRGPCRHLEHREEKRTVSTRALLPPCMLILTMHVIPNEMLPHPREII